MARRKPNALDRDIADYVWNLPPGRHCIEVRDSVGLDYPPLKPEGGMMLERDYHRITFIPSSSSSCNE